MSTIALFRTNSIKIDEISGNSENNFLKIHNNIQYEAETFSSNEGILQALTIEISNLDIDDYTVNQTVTQSASGVQYAAGTVAETVSQSMNVKVIVTSGTFDTNNPVYINSQNANTTIITPAIIPITKVFRHDNKKTVVIIKNNDDALTTYHLKFGRTPINNFDYNLDHNTPP